MGYCVTRDTYAFNNDDRTNIWLTNQIIHTVWGENGELVNGADEIVGTIKDECFNEAK